MKQAHPVHTSHKRAFSTRRMVTDALFAALFVAVSLFTIQLPEAIGKFSFSSLPIIFCAFLMGPWDAFAVALIGKFLEQLLHYGLSPTTPLWILPFLLLGLFIGYAVRLLPSLHDTKAPHRRRLTVFVVVVCMGELLLTATNTALMYVDGMIWSYPVAAINLILVPRLLNCALRTVLTCILVYFLLPPVQKLFLMRKKQ